MSSSSPLQPTPGYVVIKPIAAETTTASGFILPENSNEKPLSGEVIAVGADICHCSDDKNSSCSGKSPVKVGDQVVYKKWGGNEVTINEEDYQILKFEDILAKIA